MATLLFCLGALGLSGALASAYGLGSSFDSLCLDTPPPPGFSLEAFRRADATLWPLGTSCEFGAGTAASVVVPEQDWTNTIYAASGLVLVAIGSGVGAHAALRRITHEGSPTN